MINVFRLLGGIQNVRVIIKRSGNCRGIPSRYRQMRCFTQTSSLQHAKEEQQTVHSNEESLWSGSSFSGSLMKIHESEVKLKNILEHSLFMNSYEDYAKHSYDYPKIETMKNLQKASLKPFGDILDLIREKDLYVPKRGCIVEFYDYNSAKATIGVVLKESEAKFNENYNKMSVLTIDNIIHQVSPASVTFCTCKVFRSDWLLSLKIHRFREEGYEVERLILVNLVKHFVMESTGLMNYLEDANFNQFELAFFQNAYKFRCNCISLAQLYQSFCIKEFRMKYINLTLFLQESLLLACHLGMIKSPDKWMVSSTHSLRRVSNLMRFGGSNQLCRGSEYFCNSLVNMKAISKLSAEVADPFLLESDRKFLHSLFSDSNIRLKSSEDMGFYFNIWEGKEYLHLIIVLKFYLVYPHNFIERILKKVILIEDNALVNPKMVFDILKKINLYNYESNSFTDIFLSANICGEPKLNQLAASDWTDLKLDPDYPLTDSKLSVSDKFPHLRKSKSYYRDHVIYAIPLTFSLGDMGKSSFLGISLEKLNARKYKINVHMPDVVTKVSPSGDNFNSLCNLDSYFSLLSNLIGARPNLGEAFFDQFKFSDQNLVNESSQFLAGNISWKQNKKRKKANTTSLTMSFEYNKYDSKPFENLASRVTFSFDQLGMQPIKTINWYELARVLDIKKDLGPFSLFTRKRRESESLPKLNEVDKHNLGFIFSVLKSHFSIRNLGGAACSGPTKSFEISNAKNLHKDKLIYKDDEDRELLRTNVVRFKANDVEFYEDALFFVNELKIFVGNVTAKYCSKNDIPVYAQFHRLIEQPEYEESNENYPLGNSEVNDEVFVTHNNTLLPDYHAGNYFHTLLSRDSSGFVSDSAYFIALNYLNFHERGLTSPSGGTNLKEGTANGLVKMISFPGDLEVMLNHLQILLHVQRHSSSLISIDEGHFGSQRKVQSFSYLLGYGYNVNGPFDGDILLSHANHLSNSDNYSKSFGYLHKNFWTLTMLEQGIDRSNANTGENAPTYDCIITSSGDLLHHLSARLQRAYCIDLDIEVDIFCNIDTETYIGDQVKCDKILYLDAISGQCVLRASPVVLE